VGGDVAPVPPYFPDDSRKDDIALISLVPLLFAKIKKLTNIKNCSTFNDTAIGLSVHGRNA
jgi:hypothetical protein